MNYPGPATGATSLGAGEVLYPAPITTLSDLLLPEIKGIPCCGPRWYAFEASITRTKSVVIGQQLVNGIYVDVRKNTSTLKDGSIKHWYGVAYSYRSMDDHWDITIKPRIDVEA